ncbi:UNVERIFIED_CONTAM: putative transposon Ty5-1 protein [Sesamum calycinum]|uniref:Transposon Ty5-1 protein n=1 Tax=Sesamum calycinum TaxID=2727403 RepID=A0AAW2LHC6_9LAMI
MPLLGKVPEFVWSGKNIDLSSLRVFGCSAFVFQNNDKLEPRAQKCVFIGYPEGVKGYRLWLRNQPGFKFKRSAYDPCLYFKYESDIPVFLVLYVDDMLIDSPSLTLIENLQKNLCKNFEMKDLGNAKKILGSVMYLMVSTRPDIAYVVSCLSRYMSNAGLPTGKHLNGYSGTTFLGPGGKATMKLVSGHLDLVQGGTC